MSPIPSPWEASTPLTYRTPKYYAYNVEGGRRYSLGVILLTGRPTDIEIKISTGDY